MGAQNGSPDGSHVVCCASGQFGGQCPLPSLLAVPPLGTDGAVGGALTGHCSGGGTLRLNHRPQGGPCWAPAGDGGHHRLPPFGGGDPPGEGCVTRLPRALLIPLLGALRWVDSARGLPGPASGPPPGAPRPLVATRLRVVVGPPHPPFWAGSSAPKPGQIRPVLGRIFPDFWGPAVHRPGGVGGLRPLP